MSQKIVAAFPEEVRKARKPLYLRVKLGHNGAHHEFGIVPDLVFGLKFADGSRRCFMVEIDRGTMPITRTDIRQTSFERKMRGYLTAHAAGQHKRQFGWRTFRVLTITTDENRLQSMIEAAQKLHIPYSPGPSLFFFGIRDDVSRRDPMVHFWKDGRGRDARLA